MCYDLSFKSNSATIVMLSEIFSRTTLGISISKSAGVTAKLVFIKITSPSLPIEILVVIFFVFQCMLRLPLTVYSFSALRFVIEKSLTIPLNVALGYVSLSI